MAGLLPNATVSTTAFRLLSKAEPYIRKYLFPDLLVCVNLGVTDCLDVPGPIWPRPRFATEVAAADRIDRRRSN